MIVVGDTVQFDPFDTITGFSSGDFRGNLVKGTVVMVNYKNKWFSIEYGEHKLRTSYKFCDIGEAVTVCGD